MRLGMEMSIIAVSILGCVEPFLAMEGLSLYVC